jgi:predicted ATP-grasp superfamily ATP-dependent carboligase
LTGVAKLDFKRNERGDLLLLEVNPRFTLWHHPAALAGLNIPALVFADLTRRRRPEPGSANPGVRWCSPWEDAAAARESGELGVGWLLGTLRCEAKYGLSWRDPMPFVRGVAIPRLRARSRRWLRRRRTSRRPAPSEQRS